MFQLYVVMKVVTCDFDATAHDTLCQWPVENHDMDAYRIDSPWGFGAGIASAYSESSAAEFSGPALLFSSTF
jgi:hypothetical protein